MCEARCDTKRTDCGKFAYEYPRRQPITSRHWPACVSTRNTASTTAKTQQRARLFLGLLLEREPAAPPTAHARYSLSLSIFDWVMCFESLSPFPSIRSISSCLSLFHRTIFSFCPPLGRCRFKRRSRRHTGRAIPFESEHFRLTLYFQTGTRCSFVSITSLLHTHSARADILY